MPSDWREKMRPATFRGVAFSIDSAEFSGGRRVVRHKYPQRDQVFTEDMGKEQRAFPVEAFLLGDDFLDQVEDLVEALETPGPGELVHPYFGTHNVIAPSFTVRVRKDEGGFASVSIQFEHTDTEPAFPSVSIDSASKIATSADSAFVAVGVDLTAVHDLTGLSVSAISKVAGVVSAAGAQLRGILGPLAATAQELARLQASLGELVDDAEQLVRAPADLLSAIGDMFLGLEPEDPRAGVAALLAAYNFNPPPPPTADTPRGVRQLATFNAVQRTIQRMAVIQAARTAVAGSSSVAARGGKTSAFPSYEDAVTARDAVADAIDEQLELASDTVFPALMQLRADLIAGLPGDDSELAHLIQHTPPATVPSLVLSHRLYGNLDGEADLLKRNRIYHPGFIRGLRQLEVLSRA